MDSLSMNDNIFFNFIGSKWFSLVLGIAMCGLLLVTYSNVMVVYNAGELAALWYVPLIFVINIITIIMAFYKFMSGLSKGKEKEEW